MRRGVPVSRVGAGLTAVALSLGLVLGGCSRAAQLEAGPNRLITGERPGIDAHNTPAVAVHPSRPDTMAVAARVDTPDFSCSLYVSSDGGSGWRPVTFPLPPEARNCYWPDVAFDGEGRLLVLYTATGGRFNLPVSVWLQRLEDASPAGPPVRVAGPLAFHAHLAVDGGRVLATWMQAGPATVDKPVGFAPPHSVMLARSDDGGRNFGPPVRVSEPARRVALPTVLAGSRDEVVVGALDLGDDALDYEALHESQGGPPPEGTWRLVTWTSADAGATFGPASTVSEMVIPQRIIVNLGPVPSFGRDATTGRLYAAWDAGRGDERDVFVASSDDGGRRWSPPTRVVSRPRTQHLPAVDVAPDGRVDVVFYDRSREPDDVTTEVAVASSWDRGRSFTVATVSDRSFSSGIGFGSAQGLPVLSSQLAILSRPGHALAFWADTRRGTEDTNRQDVVVARVTARPERSLAWLPVALGAAAVVGAVLLLLATRRGRNDRKDAKDRQERTVL